MRLVLFVILWTSLSGIGILLNCYRDNQSQCIQCAPGYWLNSNNICQSLEACQSMDQHNCLQCNHTKCLYDGQPKQCRAGYFLRWTFSRFICISCKGMFCGICDERGECVSCMDGFGMIKQSSECYPCPQGCKGCGSGQAICTTCYPSYDLDNLTGLCYPRSSYIGKFLDSNYNLVDCVANCKFCVRNAADCQQCSQGFYALRKLAVSCQPCPSKCLTCLNLTHCTSCRSGLLRYYSCEDSCLDSQFYSYVESRCKSCDSSCLSCYSTRDNCTACRDPIQFRLENYTCIQRCPSGKFAIAKNQTSYNLKIFKDGYAGCANCSANCSLCTNSSYCLKCTTGFMKDGWCLIQCPIGYYSRQLIGSKICLRCQASCKLCVDHNKCSECDAGYSLLNGRCILEQSSSCSGYMLNQLCLSVCPVNTVHVQLTCQCHSSCNRCVYQPSNKQLTCLQCLDPQWYEYDGICVIECPVYYVGKKCVERCPDRYKLQDRQCVEKCTGVQTEIECISYNSTKYIDYQKLYVNQPYQKGCPTGCDKCLSNDRCLKCSNGFLQNSTNYTLGCGTCHTNYVALLQTQLCQPCRNNCSGCVEFLYLSQNKCEIVCHGDILQTNKCVDKSQINITLHGYRTPMNQYSHTQPLIITIKNNYDSKSEIDFIQLTSPLGDGYTTFLKSFDYNFVNITLNSTILKPSTVYTLFVHDRDQYQSEQFITVDQASAIFILSSDSYQPFQELFFTIRNFNSSGSYGFRYIITISSRMDGEITICSGYADINLPSTDYNIGFKMPLMRSDNNNLSITLMSNYSNISSSHLISSSETYDKMEKILQQLNYMTYNNYSVVVSSFRAVVGHKYSRVKANQCSLCVNGQCRKKQECICHSLYYGRYCQYSNSQKLQITQAQNKLLNFMKTNRRLLSSLASSDKLTILSAVVAYPDILDSLKLVAVQQALDQLPPSDPVAYLSVIMGIQDSCEVLKVDCIDYLKDKLLITVSRLPSLNLTQYAYYSELLDLRTVNSNYGIKQQLIKQDVPYIGLSADLWSVSYFYHDLPNGSYFQALYPYLIRFQMQQQSYYYFSYGGSQHKTPIKIKLPIQLSSQQEQIYQCRSPDSVTDVVNGTCSAYGSTWVVLQIKQKIEDRTSSPVGMLVYAVILFFTLFALLIVSEVRYCQKNKAQVAAENASVIGLQSRTKRKQGLDDLTDAGNREKSIDMGGVPIEKDVDLEVVSSSEQHLPPESNTKEVSLNSQNNQNWFTYFHILKSSVVWPQALFICSFFIQVSCCHLAVITMIQIEGLITFVVGITVLVSVYLNIIVLVARCMKNCFSRRGTPIFSLIIVGLIMIVVGLISVATEGTVQQLIDWMIAVAILIFNIVIKDGLIYLYCRARNEQKHRLASLLRRYVRWQHLISLVEEAKQAQQ